MAMLDPYSQAAEDPTQQTGLLRILQQIQALQTRPLIPDNPLSQLGAALQGASAGFAGRPNPAIQQALAQRQQQMAGLSQTAGVLGSVASMQHQQAVLAETRRARTVQEEAERRQLETEKRKGLREGQKIALDMARLRYDFAGKLMAQPSSAAKLEGQRLLGETLGQLGYTVTPELVTSLGAVPPTKEQLLTIVRLRASNVPIDHIAKSLPGVDRETVKFLADAIDKKDDMTLKAFGLTSFTEIETERAKLAAEKMRLKVAEAKLGDVGKEAGQIKETNVQSMRREFNALSKTFIDVKESFQRIQETARNPSAFGDIGLIFGYMRMLDPTSTVRETEFATAEQAGSIPTRVVNMYNRAVAGERLTDAQRVDIVGQARALFSRQLGNQERLETEYRRIAEERKIPASGILVDHIGPFRGLTSRPMAANAPPAPATVDDAKREFARLKKQYPSLTSDQVKDLMRGAGWR